VETFRHWKRILPSFANRKGSSACFSIGDLVAAAVLRRLTDTCGVRIGSMVQISKKIVDLCNATSWTALEGKVLVIDLLGGSCRVTTNQIDRRSDHVVMTCPLAPVLGELRDALLRSQPPTDQRHLLFPPAEVARKSRQGQL